MKRYLVVIAILVSAIIANKMLSRSELPVSRADLELFPNSLGEWQSIDEQTIDERSMNVLLVDDYIMRSYYNKKSHKIINLYIGYFKNQREGKQIHSPRQCLPGAGFTLERKGIIEIVMDNENTEKVPVNLFIMRKGNERQVFLWWYQGRGRIYAS
jgi:EpsI family protein